MALGRETGKRGGGVEDEEGEVRVRNGKTGRERRAGGGGGVETERPRQTVTQRERE